ncbi:MAG: peptidylprolyl isomerase [Treponema sp.]|nr:peptidylprolyl isomerase [Treponema sp.]
MKRFIFAILALFTAVCVYSQADLQPAATVNLIRTEAITVRQLRTEVTRMEQSAGRVLTQAERLQVLDVMINERLILQAAERDRIIVTDNEINQQLTQLRTAFSQQFTQQFGRQPTDAEFADAILRETGLTLEAYREQVRRTGIAQKYLFHKKGDLLNTLRPPTEEEILAEYNLSRTSLIRPETIRFTLIQIPYGPDAASRQRARTLADNLVREINNDATKFDEVAARSVAPNSGYQAGDAGYLPRTQDVRNAVGQVFMDAAFGLRQGQVSRLIEGPLGFQIIKVTENYAQRNLELNDIIQLGTRITVREYIGQAMLNHRQQLIVARATQELIAELRSSRTFTIFENNIRW